MIIIIIIIMYQGRNAIYFLKAQLDNNSYPMAYFWVQERAVVSYLALSVLYMWAISGTKGSSGFGSVSREHIESNTCNTPLWIKCTTLISIFVHPKIIPFSWISSKLKIFLPFFFLKSLMLQFIFITFIFSSCVGFVV